MRNIELERVDRRVNHRSFDYYAQLGRVRDYVQTHLSEDLSVRTLAGVAGLSDKYFSSFFRSKTGVRLHDWVHCQRVHRAMRLLGDRDDTVTAVAYMVGYRDVRTFERAFKRFAGTTPRDYKNSVRPA